MKRFISLFTIIMILACAAMPSFADSKSYIGSCANSFYTTSKITIVKDDYFEDVNIYAKLGALPDQIQYIIQILCYLIMRPVRLLKAIIMYYWYLETPIHGTGETLRELTI